MKKGVKFGIIVLVVVLVFVIIYFSPFKGKPEILSSCGVQGQTVHFSNFLSPDECCKGLDNVHTSDSVSIADECYWNGMESGAPIIICSDCGNGICEEVESVCGCKEDCVGKGKSRYQTVQEFCESGYLNYCENLPEGFELDLCNLC
jgi:hypothetical protein